MGKSVARVIAESLGIKYKILSIAIDKDGGLILDLKYAANYRSNSLTTEIDGSIHIAKMSFHASLKSPDTNLITLTVDRNRDGRTRSQSATKALKVYNNFFPVHCRIHPFFNEESQIDKGISSSFSIGCVDMPLKNGSMSPCTLMTAIFISRSSKTVGREVVGPFGITEFKVGNFNLAILATVIPCPPLRHGINSAAISSKVDEIFSSNEIMIGLDFAGLFDFAFDIRDTLLENYLNLVDVDDVNKVLADQNKSKGELLLSLRMLSRPPQKADTALKSGPGR